MHCLKKCFAILLTLIFLINIGGYKLIYYFLEKSATNCLELSIDNKEYDDATLVEVKIPLLMPYYGDKAMELAYGETEINHKKYRFVKREIKNNVLHLWCLPHIVKDKLIIAKSNLEKNLGNEKNSKKNNTFKIFEIDFCENNIEKYEAKKQYYLKTIYIVTNIAHKNLLALKAVEQPPEIV